MFPFFFEFGRTELHCAPKSSWKGIATLQSKSPLKHKRKYFRVTELRSMQLGDSYARSKKAKDEIALDENASGHVMVIFRRSSAVVQHDKHWFCPLLVGYPSRVRQTREGIYIQAHV
jgi:hypothetical protein